MFEDPRVVSALIAAIVSIAIASTSGLYVIIKSRKEIETLKSKIVAENHAKRFLEEATIYRSNFKKFIDKRRTLHAELDAGSKGGDGTEILQHVLDFYGVTKEYYQDNSSLLKTQDIDEDFLVIQRIIDSGIINDHENVDRMESVNLVFKKCIQLFEKMYNKSVS